MTLAPHERAHPLMLKLIEHWKADLATLRAQNDGALDHDKTTTLRGRISQLKACIALGDEPPVID